ncbi:MAG: Hpt domain-containing protein, partial [Ekhidna sp.]|nr:Hpt domain-containing protein [Ekhidna sp.]
MDIELTPQEEKELKEMFFFESQQRHQDLNELLTSLENDLENHMVIDDILRITHTMKGNAMGMGQTGIAELAHTMEEVFEAVNKGQISLSRELFTMLYKLTDKIGQLINNVKEGKKISHKGIKMRIQVFLRESRKDRGVVSEPEQQVSEPAYQVATEPTVEVPEEKEEQQHEEHALEAETLAKDIERDQVQETEELEEASNPSFFAKLRFKISNLFKRDLGGDRRINPSVIDDAPKTQPSEPMVSEVEVPPSPAVQPPPIPEEIEEPNFTHTQPVETSIDDRPNFTVDDEKSV